MSVFSHILFCLFVFCSSRATTQTFFKNNKAIMVWKVGDVKTKTATLKNGSSIMLDYDDFTLNASLIKKEHLIVLHKFNDGGPWNKLEITVYDFDKDGIAEIAITYGDTKSLLFGLLVYKIKNAAAVQIADLQGQGSCSFYKNRITLQQDTKGNLVTYMLKAGKFENNLK
jgi:hypothetical protein